MKTHNLQIKKWIGALSVLFMVLWSFTANAQVYSSGSTGADGAFAATSSMSLTLPPNGVFNFTTVNIPAGITVTFINNAANTPVTILATGDINIYGTISVNGQSGLNPVNNGLYINQGGAGGPGGFAGGQGGLLGGFPPGDGQGPGGGICCVSYYLGTSGSSGTYAVPASTLTLTGGSGGSGYYGSPGANGPSGGGGGGAILIASSTKINLTGNITANGGTGVGGNPYTGTAYSGYGSAGAIRLVATQIVGAGLIQASQPNAGWIRIEAFIFNFTGTISPAPSVSATPGPVSGNSNPAYDMTNLFPALSITSVGGVTTPANFSGSYQTPDISLPLGTSNPLTVTLAASKIPVGTVFTVRVIPQNALSSSYNTSPSTGAFSGTTASAKVTFPSGQISVLNAYASFTLPAQVASLYPLIDGEPVERVVVAANYGEPSTVTFISKSGKTLNANQLSKGLR